MSELALQLIEKEKRERTGYLDLGNCGLSELPEELFELTWLKTLTLSSIWRDWDESKHSINIIELQSDQIDKNYDELKSYTLNYALLQLGERASYKK